MIKGETKTGFCYAIEEERPDNMELLDAIAESEEDPTQVSIVAKLLLGPEQKKKLWDHVRVADGRVPIEAAMSEISDILQDSRTDGGKAGGLKNS